MFPINVKKTVDKLAWMKIMRQPTASNFFVSHDRDGNV